MDSDSSSFGFLILTYIFFIFFQLLAVTSAVRTSIYLSIPASDEKKSKKYIYICSLLCLFVLYSPFFSLLLFWERGWKSLLPPLLFTGFGPCIYLYVYNPRSLQPNSSSSQPPFFASFHFASLSLKCIHHRSQHRTAPTPLTSRSSNRCAYIHEYVRGNHSCGRRVGVEGWWW